jgi:DUF1680 family protein
MPLTRPGKAAGSVLLFLILTQFAPSAAPADIKKNYPITPIPFTAVKVTDGFWAPRIETNRTVTIPAIFKKCEETGRIDNFAFAGGLLKGEYKGERYNDTDVYKTIEGAFPMEARRVTAHLAVKDDAGFVAVERGPLVYCAEAPDNGGRALNLVLPDGAALRPEERAGLLGGIVVLTGEALAADPAAVTRVGEAGAKDAAADDEEEAPPASRRRLAPGAALKPHQLVLIPYYAWAHRGDGEMSVWLFKSGTQYQFPH